jgi:hypothetical protein
MFLRKRFVLMFTRTALTMAFGTAMTLVGTAQQAPQPSPSPARRAPLVAVKALRTLMPDLTGWEVVREGGDQIAMSDTCGWMFADVSVTKGDMKVRVTVADTGFDSDGLAMLAPFVMSFPDDSVNVVERATIKRFALNGFPAASRWDNDNKDGEFTVVVGTRFVASAEGSHLDGIDTLRGIVERIDLKKLSELK